MNSSPSIWREIQVHRETTFFELHHIIQITMGWQNYHLYEFNTEGYRIGEISEDSMEDYGSNELLNSRDIKLVDVITVGETLSYEYDFGDGWEHTVTVEKLANIPEGHAVRIACLGGRRRCPPEDVGGPPGYANYLEALANPKHGDHKDMLRWRGKFDPKAFDLDKVNRELTKLVRWSRHRKY